MALTAGSCTIDAEGNVSGTGLAKAMADALMATPPAGLSTNQMLAQWTNLLAAAIVDHLVSNAAISVTVAPSDAGLQRTPNPNDPNTPTQGPAAEVVLAGSLT